MTLIYLYKDYHHYGNTDKMVIGRVSYMSSGVQFHPSLQMHFDFTQISLLILNCVTINRNVNYDVKTERVKVKAAQQ